MPLTPDDIDAFLREGEGARVEFKRDLHQPRILIKLISAFANGDGGTIIIGVEEPDQIVGTDTRSIRTLLDQALTRLDPIPNTAFHTVNVDGKEIAVIIVSSGEGPVFSDEGVFVRAGAITTPMSSTDLTSALQQKTENGQLERITKAITSQTELIEQLHDNLAYERNWRSKFVDWFIGGAIGAILGSLLSALVG